jgi:anti-sigma-K factor RskA
VWQRIAAEAGLESSRPVAVPDSSADSPAEPIQARRLSPVEPVADPAARSVVRRRAGWLAAAAVVGAALGTSATLGWQALHDNEPTVVASATLQPLPAKHGSGTAEVETATSGRELSVRVQGAAPKGSFLEVWLMSDPQHLISLGVMDEDAATFAVPAGIDLDTYKVVDVSIEPYDGNPAHSSDSLVRGTLTPS